MSKKLEKKFSVSNELKERTYKFALRILELGSMLPNTEERRLIRSQLCKSGTSVGVPIYIGKEADGSLTLNDFIYKIDIAFMECKETRYWLRIIGNRKLLKKEVVIPHLN